MSPGTERIVDLKSYAAPKFVRSSAVDLLGELIPILSVSSTMEDHEILEHLMDRRRWTVRRAYSIAEAVAILQDESFPVVLCEHKILRNTWRDLLGELENFPLPPFLVLVSHLADEELWTEALGLGAYDVLPKPFDPRELSRVVGLASRDWHRRFQHHSTHSPRTIAAR